MDEKSYIELLDKGYDELPEVLHKKERFEVPEVRGRIVKTRTHITNFKEVAKHLSRDTNHMFRYIIKFVGVRGDLQEEKGEVVLHSRFQPAVLNKGVTSYFNEYVVCPHCNSPDTDLIENDTIKKCNACGHQEKVRKI